MNAVNWQKKIEPRKCADSGFTRGYLTGKISQYELRGCLITQFPVAKMADQLTEEQIDEFKAAFLSFDRNSDGAIDSTELANVMKYIFGKIPTRKEVNRLFKAVDADSKFNRIWVLKYETLDTFREQIHWLFWICYHDGESERYDPWGPSKEVQYGR